MIAAPDGHGDAHARKRLAVVKMCDGSVYHVRTAALSPDEYRDVLTAVPPNNWWTLEDVGPAAPCVCCPHYRPAPRRVEINATHISSITIVEDR